MTDRELHARWKKNREEFEKIRTSKAKANIARKAELAAELKMIGYEWNELYLRKTRGGITDRTGIELVKRVVQSVAVGFAIAVKIGSRAMEPDDDMIIDAYIVAAANGEWSEAAADRFGIAVAKEVREADPAAIIRLRNGPLWDTDEMIYDNSGDDLYHHILSSGGMIWVQWVVDLYTWDGPGEPYLGRESGGAMRGRFNR